MLSNKTAIQHPCNAWAVSAGLTSWAAALDEMRAGKVLCGTLRAVSPGSKSTLGLQLFLEQVSKEGLHVVVSEMGGCIVGLKSNFPVHQVDPESLTRNRINERTVVAEAHPVTCQASGNGDEKSQMRAGRK